MLSQFLTSCASKTVVIIPDLYFPQFPAPEDITFLDKNKEEVTTEEKEIKYILLPYEWYSGPLLDFKNEYDETKLYYSELKKGYSAVVDGK